MNTYRVTVTDADGDKDTVWVEARNAQHACMMAVAQEDWSEHFISLLVGITAVLETS